MSAFKATCVCLATQVLSRSVAAGLNTHVSIGKLPSTVVHTAEFISKWNDIFDSVNRRTFQACEELKRPVKTTSPHLSFWMDVIEWIKGVHFNTSRTSHCLVGWRLTLRAILGLMQDFQSIKGFKFLLTSRLNQDCLENLFALLRQKRGNRDNPDPNQFRFIFRQIQCNFLISPSSSANCVPDFDSLLLTLSDINKAHTHSRSVSKVPSTSTSESCNISDLSYDYQVDALDANGVNYGLGYVLKN